MRAVAIDPDDLDRMMHLASIFDLLDKLGMKLTEISTPETVIEVLEYLNDLTTPYVADEEGMRHTVMCWLEGYIRMFGSLDPPPPEPNAPGVDTPQ